MFDRLVRAQHFSLPTRLLDVSLNPLAALCFACTGAEAADGQVVVFDIPKDRFKLADSDAVSLICNMARLGDAENQKIEDACKIDTDPDDPEAFWADVSAMQRLFQFVRSESPGSCRARNRWTWGGLLSI